MPVQRKSIDMKYHRLRSVRRQASAVRENQGPEMILKSPEANISLSPDISTRLPGNVETNCVPAWVHENRDDNTEKP